MKTSTILRLVILFFLLIFSNISFSQNYSNGDVNITTTYYSSHDSATCKSKAEIVLRVTIQNSQIDDEFQLWDWDFAFHRWQPIAVEKKTYISNLWYFDITVPTGEHCDDWLSGSNYSQYFNIFVGSKWKSILVRKNGNQTSLDTIHNILPETQIFVSNPCKYINISGRSYLDKNSNCIFDSTDIIIPNFQNHINFPNPIWCVNRLAYNSSSGLYDFEVNKALLPITIALNNDFQFIFQPVQCSKTSYDINYYSQSGIDFALQCGSEIDLYAESIGPKRARPNQPFIIHSSVGNIGCTEASGQLKLVLDPRVVYDTTGSSHPADTVLTSPTGDTLVWEFMNLNSFNKGPYWNAFLSEIKVTPLTTVAIGDTLHFKYWTNIPSIDADSYNNQGTFDVEIRTAFDPNEKTVSPKGEGPNGNIDPTTQKLKYTIQFQNTGSDYAQNIYVIDTLDAAIDPTSLRIEMTSHAMNPEWLAPNVVKFNFPNIHLLDSTTNEAASHGSVTFNVRLKPNLSIGTEIKNIGYIYFDYNAPVLTNYAINTLYEKSNSINEIENESGIILFPNPAQDNISIKSSIELKSAKIISTDGKIVNDFNLTNSQKNLDISSLKIGTYLVEIESTTGYIQRLKFLKR